MSFVAGLNWFLQIMSQILFVPFLDVCLCLGRTSFFFFSPYNWTGIHFILFFSIVLVEIYICLEIELMDIKKGFELCCFCLWMSLNLNANYCDIVLSTKLWWLFGRSENLSSLCFIEYFTKKLINLFYLIQFWIRNCDPVLFIFA